ncbi:MAG: (4Fe-4S)-binding protein [Chitinophagales bacterium]
MEDIIKEYTNGEITVVWQPKKCIHSAKCWHGLGDVFNPKIKPWIDVAKATSQQITEQVHLCPSGALSIKDEFKNEDNSKNDFTSTEIAVLKNGPLMIKGSLSLKHKDGKEEIHSEIYLCRCGQSDNKPFCDGTHKKCGFKDE